ncbi:hypothetical protein L4Z68_001349 [Pseudomonas aeruginosa]|uniref:hypothetical protein n=1 Tax=Pseudomonas aeruginosa TaxID=287 RepID=UPI000FC43466|nr:hypothetical protein [Pseudomonas aeruginosa]EKU6307905.1 hypothetical protein [Pseudomonas aeruginosa]EKX2969356.1 hypothetical protein [Pseudomonas aeruginosa]RUE86324.1 hypothetical protein IPC1135_29590 [Pseudomonas aeruginosa]HBO6962724.1 hypothetical protein [Pseudomonas aeruginosa]HBO7218671.1 hypothetical protein [Pseudomonas aeruginosa]
MLATTYPLDPRIGVLVRNGAAVFYAHVNGYEHEPIEGTLNEVESSLGIALSPVQDVGPERIAPPAPIPGRESGGLRLYEVTMTPNVITYGGSHTYGEAVEYVYAESRADAERQVRQQLRDTNGRHGPRYKVSARLA